MYYSEWISNFNSLDFLIGFLVHEQPITYGSSWERFGGFYINFGPRHVNKRIRPKTRILKICGGYYVKNVERRVYKEHIKFITMNQKLTPAEEIRINGGIKFGRL